MRSNTGKLNSLQLLRAIAVLLVVYCHVLDVQPDHNAAGVSFQQHFFYLQNFGAIGVDIFFVISGFIITVISYRYATDNAAGYFIVKRLVRIVPVYWLVSLFPVVYYFIRGGKPVAAAAIIKTVSFFPFSRKVFFDTPVLFIGWTLSFELLFYLVIFIGMLINRKRYWGIAVLFLLILVGLNFISSGTDSLINFFGNGIILEFLMGALAGLFFLSPLILKRAVVLSFLVAGMVAMLATVFTGYGEISEAGSIWTRSLSLTRVVVWGLPASLLVTGVVFREKRHPVAIYPGLILLGDASYSIYLTHPLILISLYARWTKWGLTEKLSPDLLIVLSIALAVLGGCIFYKLVELPLLRFLNTRIDRFRMPGSQNTKK